MFLARTLLRDWIQTRFHKQWELINQGLIKDGAYYLLTLRLLPIVPFFIVNVVMGVSNFPVKTFMWVSQLGMLAGTIIYVNAGSQLGQIKTLSDVTSPSLLASLAMLAVFPILLHKVLLWFNQRRDQLPENTSN